MSAPPVVGVLACRKRRANGTSYSRVNDLVVEQLTRYAGVAAVLVPAVAAGSAAALVSTLDGLVLPGSGSFVHPRRYGAAAVADREYDPDRDEVALRLLAAAADRPELPVLASCRGMHELAVAAGARLSPVGVTAVKHRLVVGPNAPDRWAPAHPVAIRPGGVLADLVGPATGGTAVNSAHSDQVTALPPTVRVEAVAPDGVIEAISVGWPARFVLGVQWHVEQGTERSDLDRRLLAAFGQRCGAAAGAGVPG